MSVNQNLPSPGQIVSDDERGSHGQLGQGSRSPRGSIYRPVPGGFAEKYLNERKDGDPLQRGKVLPDDQLENNKGRELR